MSVVKEYISEISHGRTPSRDNARAAMLEIISGKVESGVIAEFLVAINTRGVTVEEMVGFAKAIREKMLPLETELSISAVDLCGTGGDRKGTFNISTTASFVVAAAGLSVAKHGNRSVSSKCGSADILERAGARIDISPELAGRCLTDIGFTFLFAPNFHPAMKSVASVRRSLGVPTIFNILGPLSNPASVKRQVIGVYEQSLCNLVASTLKELCHECALVVHSDDGLDEISPCSETKGLLLSGMSIRDITIVPEVLGIKRGVIDALLVKDINDSIHIMQSVLNGEKSTARDAVLLNAAGALYVGGKSPSIREGIGIAAENIDSGKAKRKLEEFIRASNLK